MSILICEQLAQMSLLPTELARIEHLKALFQEVCLPSARSPSHYTTLRDKLVQQKLSLNGQSSPGMVLQPPPSSITAQQSNARRASVASAQNLSRLASSPASCGRPSSYDRTKRGRIQDAQSRDPTAYNLYKRGVEGANIQCDCGGWLVNTKRARHYHTQSHKGHLAWLTRRQGSAVGQDADAAAGDDAAANPGDAQDINEPGVGSAVDDAASNVKEGDAFFLWYFEYTHTCAR